MLRLVCQYMQAMDKDGKVTDTGGERLFTVAFDRDGVAEIRKEGLNHPFKGKVSDNEIRGAVSYVVDDKPIEETITIDRVKGWFSATYGSPGRSGLFFSGECRNAPQKRF